MLCNSGYICQTVSRKYSHFVLFLRDTILSSVSRNEIVEREKSFTDGNFIKECLMEAVNELCPKNSNLFASRFIPVMGFKFLRTGSLLYRTNQQQVRPSPAMGFKIFRSGTAFERLNHKLRDYREKNRKIED